MARIRTIKPDMGESKNFAKLSFAARYFFCLLLCHIDDEGRLEYFPKRLAGDMYAEDEDVSASTIRGWVEECVNAELVQEYSVGDANYLFLPTFLKHQKIEKPSASKCPPPPGFEPKTDDSPNTPRTLPDSSPKPHRQEKGKGKEEKGNWNKEKEKEEIPAEPCQVSLKVLEELCKRTGKEFKPQAAYCGGLYARIRDGATLDQLLHVVRVKCDQWMGNARMENRCTPETLFRPQNFERYVLESLPREPEKPPRQREPVPQENSIPRGHRAEEVGVAG